MGILPLNVGSGRYVRKPLNERLCHLCTEGEIEFFFLDYLTIVDIAKWKDNFFFFNYVAVVYLTKREDEFLFLNYVTVVDLTERKYDFLFLNNCLLKSLNSFSLESSPPSEILLISSE